MSLSIESRAGSQEPILTITRKLPPGPDGVAPAMHFPINAATTVEFKGDRFLHAWVAHEFGAGNTTRHSAPAAAQVDLVARARQFSSFLLLVRKTACLFCYRVSRRTEYLPRQARDKCIGNVETKAVSAGRQNLGAGQFCPGARNYLAEQGRADAAAAARAATYPPGAKNAAFLHHFVLGLKTIILPRQARDKHGENSKKSTRFLAGVQGCDRVALSRAETFRHRNPRDAARVIGLRSEKKRLLRHFYTKSIILPRQARDKHREKHSKKHNIHACGFCSAGVCVVQLKPQLEALLGLDDDALTKEIKLTQVGAKNACRFLIGCAILYILKTPSFYQDRLGTNTGGTTQNSQKKSTRLLLAGSALSVY